jgi:hypothetical protein
MSRFKALQAKLDSDEGLNAKELGVYSALLRNHYEAKCREVQKLLVEVKRLTPTPVIHHDVTCRLFPSPYDEREPVGPCNCGASENGEGGL